MNLMLLDSADAAPLLPADDARARHVRDVLKMGVGDAFFVGVRNGPRGKATVAAFDSDGMRLRVTWETAVDAPLPLTALVGLPRPQTARDVLREGATLGVARLWFYRPEKGEPSYATSRLWTGDEWKTHLDRGAEQAFSTTIPQVRHFECLQDALDALAGEPLARVALDVYEGEAPLSRLVPETGALAVAVGAERGWSADERVRLRTCGFALASMGARVLRTESALLAAVAVWQARRGIY